jgi:hypothetical protein
MAKYFSLFVLLIVCTNFCNAKNHLSLCHAKQISKLNHKFVTATFTEKRDELEHNFNPWQTTTYYSKGALWLNKNSFYKTDSLLLNSKMYYSKTQFANNKLLFLDYGDEELFAVTSKFNNNQILQSCRYSPLQTLQYFANQMVPLSSESNIIQAIYITKINDAIVKLIINKKKSIVEKISVLSHDDLYGDVVTFYQYLHYKKINRIQTPTTIVISKINYHLADIVELQNVSIFDSAKSILIAPANYSIPNDKPIVPEISIEKYQDHIYFIACKHTDDRVLLVEFDTFLLVAEAPLSAENGELIIAKIKGLFPTKPIKYFVFGHHHPHYIGGIRAFIHKGATILPALYNIDYVKDIATMQHSLKPDSLQLQPKKILYEGVAKSKIITDGNIEMNIIWIGNQSEHTDDYLIYYFPKQKLLFQDDLVWIKKEGAAKKASKRQAGLYNAIKNLKLDVDTIIQSWPVADYGVKTIIPFADVEASMQVN